MIILLTEASRFNRMSQIHFVEQIGVKHLAASTNSELIGNWWWEWVSCLHLWASQQSSHLTVCRACWCTHTFVTQLKQNLLLSQKLSVCQNQIESLVKLTPWSLLRLMEIQRWVWIVKPEVYSIDWFKFLFASSQTSIGERDDPRLVHESFLGCRGKPSALHIPPHLGVGALH